ncbi:tRNA (adenosine(37)-N6)-threonylcarbamoyltransferase complex ATPase subunit type 1 TsaE [Crocinitomicaceae bacterium]|nr:tRNA (adenosine(37)-N6)-threonylcarbamoyltransferase complex ATPase subunit type 1 TsaE [Crocinitomicaceae bacterium]
MEIIIKDISDIPFATKLFLDENLGVKVFAFKGEMGVGKTTYILSILKAMGVEDVEGSPTYSLVNTYDSIAFGKINHFDLYRLESEEEAYDIGIEEMLYNDDYCFIEWPEKIVSLLPDSTVWVSIQMNENLERIVTFEKIDIDHSKF